MCIRDRAWTGLGEDACSIRPGLGESREPWTGNGLTRCEHADDAGFRRGGSGFDRWLDRDKGKRPARAQRLDGDTRGRVAGHHDGFGVVTEQELDDAERAFLDELDGLVAVRCIGGVRDVDQVFGGKLPLDFEQDRDSADTRVEYANRISGAARSIQRRRVTSGASRAWPCRARSRARLSSASAAPRLLRATPS